MPILLTTAYNPGDLDSGASYTHVSITEIRCFLGSRVSVKCQHGTYVDSVWAPGMRPPVRIEISNTPRATPPGTAYDDLIATVPEAGETIYEALATALYDWLIDEGVYPGTVV